ncbi:MAG: C45 family peptidase [Sphaerochaetaceae bacterium]|nr:C45 family peptidase [Sphaerochaetaceae bacterium]
MKAYTRIAIVLLLIFTLPCLGAQGIRELAEPVPGVSYGRATKAVHGEVKVVDLYGSWHEMGRQYGYLMKEELEDVNAFVQRIANVSEANEAKAKSMAKQQESQLPYRVLEFMKGAEETSGLTFDELQRVNAVERIGGLPQCSVAIAWGDYAADELVLGRNYDYSKVFSELFDDVAVTIYHPSDGALATATIGYTGEIYAVNAINEKGLFLELNNGKPSANIKSPNKRITGTTMLFNTMFESDELADMELFFNTTNCSSSYIINVADANRGQSFEWCPIGVKNGEDSLPEGLIVSSNYYVNPEWEFPVPTDENSWASISRRNNLINLCESMKGELDAEKMMKIIETDLQDGGAKNELTVYQIVVVPETLQLWVRVIDAPEPKWEAIDLASYLLK